MLKKCSAVTFWQQKQRLTVRWWQRCSCLARVSLRRDACRSPSAHCDYWKREKRVINSSRNTAGMSKTWGKIIKRHYSWMADRIGQVCLTPDEELLAHKIKIKDAMWRKQQLKGPLIRPWQRKSYIMGHIEVCRDNNKDGGKIKSFHISAESHMSQNPFGPECIIPGHTGSDWFSWQLHSAYDDTGINGASHVCCLPMVPSRIRTPGQVESSHLHLLWQQWGPTKMETGQFCAWSGRPGVCKSQ